MSGRGATLGDAVSRSMVNLQTTPSASLGAEQLQSSEGQSFTMQSNRSAPSLPSEQLYHPGQPPDPIPLDPSPISLASVDRNLSKRGPSLPVNPRPQSRRPAPPGRNTDYSTTNESIPPASWHSPDTQPGYFDDSGPLLNMSPTQLHPSEYNRLYAAASDVLGMSPTPPVVVGGFQQPEHLQPSEYHYEQNDAPFIPAQTTVHQDVLPLSISSFHSTASPPSRAPSLTTTDLSSDTSSDRSGHLTPEAVQTRTTKAVDLRAPPYTKEYIDGYRQRIKADPDPEAHFSYARYLIDAAKRIGADAKDQRAVRKYRDTLVQESLRVIKRLATQGQPYDEAQFFLANCYGTGMLGLQVDHEKAYHLYLQAAKQNHAAATYRVAVCNEIGAGTRKEPPRAAAFYRKAASLGDTAAMYKLGMILLQGSLGEAKNPREAVGWLRRAAEQADDENPHALHELALLHEDTSEQIVPHDPIQAKEYVSRAAYLGYTQSQYKLGQCYELGNAEAELALSGWYLTGSEGVLKQSDSEAYLWARRAANKGLAKAEYAVGYYAEVGIGIKQDIEFAKRWYMRAAAQGNKRAMNRLTEMKRQGNKRANIARPTRQQAKDECVVC
ncbi:hypothetical protein BGW80DRAFT_1289016 [Lactifluus volemus]|nr:hypothetical protein BGW80DRAFT_1289016 [Lactifluus volemus]